MTFLVQHFSLRLINSFPRLTDESDKQYMYIVGKRQGGRIKQILKHNVTESLSVNFLNF